jgi:2-oxoglutarate ferredoxin oxidoreductase subunit gamma
MTAERANTFQVRFAGEAGQGVILAGVTLAEAAMKDRRRVAQSARYGAAVRGGEATADVVISDSAIDYPHVEAPDYLVALSQPTYDRFAPLQAEGTLIVHDPFFVRPAEQAGRRQLAVAATDEAIRRFGKGTSANLIILGFLCEATRVVSWESLVAAVGEGFAPRYRDPNLEALAMGRLAAAKVAR